MSGTPLENINGYHLPVFRLLDGDIDIDPDFFHAVAREIVDRGLRLLVVRCPSSDRHDETDHDVIFPGVRQTGADYLDFSCSFNVSAPGVSEAVQAVSMLADLCLRYDIVLAWGDVRISCNILRIATAAAAVPATEGHLRLVDPAWGVDRISDLLFSWLAELCRQVPVWACILIGGKSSRMGQPKHLLRAEGNLTWLEVTVARLQAHVDGIVLSGSGDIPPALAGLTRVPDVPGVAGPLAGILAAMRWNPGVTWLLVACDMPSVTEQAIRWLLDARCPGRWAIIPRRNRDSHVEPLLACYDRRCRVWFEEQRISGSLRIGEVARRRQVYSPVIPAVFREAWNNVNTPDELRLLSGFGADQGKP